MIRGRALASLSPTGDLRMALAARALSFDSQAGQLGR